MATSFANTQRSSTSVLYVHVWLVYCREDKVCVDYAVGYPSVNMGLKSTCRVKRKRWVGMVYA